jgi:arylsulfatase A-like enzyme
MHKKTCLFSLLVFIFGLSGCPSPHGSEFRLFRFIDILDQKHIILSPLSQVQEDPYGSEGLFPVESYPLLDHGSGKNPYGIKRKLKLKGREVNALYCPPKSILRYRIKPLENMSLDFGIAITPNTEGDNFPQKGVLEKRSVTFSVSLEASGKRKKIFQKFLPPPEEGESFVFQLFTIDLTEQQEELDILFETEGDHSLHSFWVNPLCFRRQNEGLNVILISIDTLRADHLGCYGYERETSPHIDALSADSVTFVNTYASSPWTLPSHVSLLTSLHGVHHQVAYENDSMDPSMMTLADILRANQFYCAALTGGGFVSAKYGFSKGFNSYSDEGGVLRQDSAEHLFHAANRWLEREKDKGFFLFLHTFQPHSPYACPYPYKSMFLGENPRWRHLDLMSFLGGMKGIFQKLTERERQNIIGLYDGEIRYTDEKLIGPLITVLKDAGLYDRTMIIFTSDHGEEFFDHHGWGHGHNLYDESLKVPLIIKFPESRFRGRKIHDIVSLVDIFPTVLDEAGIDSSAMAIDGRSLLPLVKGKGKGDRMFMADVASHVLASRIPRKIAVNRGKEKLILNKPFSPEDLRFFLHPPPVLDPVELYDLGLDPKELRNIADERPRLANLLIRKIDEIIQAVREKKTKKLELDEDLKKQLRALGYIR